MSRYVTNMDFEGTVYYRQRSVLVLTPSFLAGPGDRTHRRASIRCILGCSGPVEVETVDGGYLRARAVLIGPTTMCQRIEADRTDMALIDFAVGSPEYLALQQRLVQNPLQEIGFEKFAHLFPRLIAGQQTTLTGTELKTMMREVVEIISGTELLPLHLDERVMLILKLIEKMPLAEIKLPRLASAVNLSAERLRHLFKSSTGATFSHYARTTAVWRALELLDDDARTVTEVSHAAGFHDVSHFYRVYADMFGISLSERNNIRKYRRIRCFD